MEHYLQLLANSYRGYARYLGHEIAHPSWDNYFYWLIGFSLFFFMLEAIRPWNKAQGPWTRDFWLDAFYMFFNFFLFSLIGFHAVSMVFVEAFNQFLLFAFGWKNLVAIQINTLPAWTQLIMLFVIRDFLQWNTHRLLHRVPFLWEFHKVHHSAKQLGFATHLRYHWMENVVYRVIQYIPLGMIGFGIQEFLLVHLVAIGIVHFNHSNIRVPLGPLKYLFNNPQMHKWHHVKAMPDQYRYGINFGLSLSVWDYVFGTAYQPYDAENLELGYPGDEEMPRPFWRQVLFPWLKKG